MAVVSSVPFSRGFVDLAGFRERGPAREVMPRALHRALGGRRLQREHIGVPREPHEHRDRHDDHRFDHRHHRGVRIQLLGDAIGRLLRIGESSLHHVRVGEEVQVVRVVHHSVHPVGRRADEIAAIGRGARRVRRGRSRMIAGARVNVRRHVEQMPR